MKEPDLAGKVAGATGSSVLVDVTADSRVVEERRNCGEDILAVKTQQDTPDLDRWAVQKMTVESLAGVLVDME